MYPLLPVFTLCFKSVRLVVLSLGSKFWVFVIRVCLLAGVLLGNVSCLRNPKNYLTLLSRFLFTLWTYLFALFLVLIALPYTLYHFLVIIDSRGYSVRFSGCFA